MDKGRIIGYVVERGHLAASAGAARSLGDLIGNSANVFIGNIHRDIWSDFWTRADAPPLIPVKPGQVLEYDRRGKAGGPKYALEKAIPGSPLLLLVEFPRDRLLAPVSAFLRNATLFALLLLVVGVIGLWRLSRNITGPLSDLRQAAMAITEGDYSHHVDTSRKDELGELSRAFEIMADRVAGAQDTMEHQLKTLEESEARYRKITEASFDGINIVVDDVVREANRGFAEIFGYTVEEVVGRPVTEFVASESLTDLAKGSYEIVGKHKSGRKITLEGMTRAHHIEGRPGQINALRDVTEKRLLETQVRQAQKMDAIGRLAGGIAHDFNNLLTVILSCTEMVLVDLPDPDPRREDLEQILAATLAAASLTQQLLTFTRQEVIQPRLVEVNSVVASAGGILKRLIGEDIELTTVLAEENPIVKIDRSQLEQVIVNLAVNARDAMPSGGKLTIETQTVDVDEAYASTHWSTTPGRYVVLAVTDTGLGMDENTQARIFEPFYTTKEAGKGTGLGLAMVYGIVKQSGGFIWLYTELGSGTSFKIYLPLVDDAAQLDGPRLILAEPAGGTETVLLVEDSAAVRSIARNILERHGYTVLEAPNGKAALDIGRKRTRLIHLLLTDVVMPEISGRQLAEEFSAIRPDAKIIFMSGYTDDAIVRHGVVSEGVDYLQKPFSPDTLLRKVRQVLDSQRNR
jgi:PAS domain S-box-containing protein